MQGIGEKLKMARTNNGVSLKEASEDLNIKEVILENIEDGNIGCFKDIFVLKDYILNYAKYLGLDGAKMVDEFNEYMFEYTSKIPIKEIEKIVNEQQKEETGEIKMNSPYTAPQKRHSKWFYIVIYVGVFLLVVGVIFWSIKQVTVNNAKTSEISIINRK